MYTHTNTYMCMYMYLPGPVPRGHADAGGVREAGRDLPRGPLSRALHDAFGLFLNDFD